MIKEYSEYTLDDLIKRLQEVREEFGNFPCGRRTASDNISLEDGGCFSVRDVQAYNQILRRLILGF